VVDREALEYWFVRFPAAITANDDWRNAPRVRKWLRRADYSVFEENRTGGGFATFCQG
jgi:hypothetical protein